jgi:hypothetical protein
LFDVLLANPLRLKKPVAAGLGRVKDRQRAPAKAASTRLKGVAELFVLFGGLFAVSLVDACLDMNLAKD